MYLAWPRVAVLEHRTRTEAANGHRIERDLRGLDGRDPLVPRRACERRVHAQAMPDQELVEAVRGVNKAASDAQLYWHRLQRPLALYAQ